ncbi:MAG: ABC transporter permease [bacterium]|nr:ABC transporter permease [bacterium]
MSLGLYLATRHLNTPHRGRAVTMTGLVAMGGILVGVLALTVIISVMNGLEAELAGLLNDGEAHIELRPRSASGIPAISPLLDNLSRQPHVVGAAPFVSSEVLLVHRGRDGRSRIQTATLKGVDAERELTVTRTFTNCHPEFNDFIPDPGWVLPEGANADPGILLGVDLAGALRIGLGQRLRMVVPAASSFRSGQLDSIQGREKWWLVVGLVDAGLAEFNSTMAIAEIDKAAEFLQIAGEAQGIGIKCDSQGQAGVVAGDLLALPAFTDFRTETWLDRNSVLFEAMAREKALMYLFLVLTMAVASLGIIGALTLMISEKRAEIGILRTLGMTKRGIMSWVVLEGWLVGLIGVASGLFLGWLIGFLLQRFPLRIPGDLFVLETVPILLNPVDFILVGTITLVVCLVATLYPGWEAARMDPIEAIRAT